MIHGAVVASNSKVRAAVVLVFLIAANWKEQSLRGVQWHGSSTKFHENPPVG
jgi:hypothetical protein